MDTTMEPTDVSYERDVRPLFRELDRDSMVETFDLWSYDDVRDHADAILTVLEAGSMPCDGAWSEVQLDTFRRWMAADSPP
jgi:hypothetical protein